mmetsp:Transcript_24583/g.67037  ORF Transcript_24583/g.67037 Transcript_24583/m.67037 type:complete len:187 (+) Transcript_24583:112-672(+)
METLGEALAGPISEVLEGVRRKWREAMAQEPLWNILMGFIHAVNWKEPWIIAILVCQMVLLTLSIMTRKKGGIQAVLFAFACGTIYMGERLNALGAKHWDKFASQNYFDQNGVFFSTMVSGPLLLLLFILLVNYLISCVQLLVEAKRKELKFKARQRRADQAGKEGASHSGSSLAGDDVKGGKKNI